MLSGCSKCLISALFYFEKIVHKNQNTDCFSDHLCVLLPVVFVLCDYALLIGCFHYLLQLLTSIFVVFYYVFCCQPLCRPTTVLTKYVFCSLWCALPSLSPSWSSPVSTWSMDSNQKQIEQAHHQTDVTGDMVSCHC